MKKKKILAVTCIRSEYYLMQELYKKLAKDPQLDFRLLVAGAHLSPSFGESVKEIEEDGINILIKIETLIDSDSKASRIKSASLLLQNSIDIVNSFNPDLIIFAADREDTIITALIGLYLEIPTIHFFAGDHVADGHADNAIRHASSKLATAQMVSLIEHKKRLLQMGEPEERVFHIGSVALDRFVKFKAGPKAELIKKFNLGSHFQNFCTLIFHPVVEEKECADEIFENILKSLVENNIPAFVSYPNSDPGNKKIVKVINKYQGNPNFYFYKNLDNETFLSVYKNSMFIIGNSSSGLLEAASIPIPAINIGMRGTGRHSEANVIRCDSSFSDITGAIKKAISAPFINSIKDIKNPYGSGDSVDRAYDIIKTYDLKKIILKKEDILPKSK